MTYQEMQKAEAELNAALSPQQKQRGATKAQLAYRARFLSPAAREIAAYEAEVYKQGRDERAARKSFTARLSR